MTVELFAHVGFGRAGSTSIQKIFENAYFHDEEKGRDRFVKVNNTNRYFVDTDLYGNPKREYDLSQISFRLKSNSVTENVRMLFSERLSGHWYSGGYDRVKISETLRSKFPGIKILLVIRNQKDHLKSIYLHYLKKGGNLPFEAYFIRKKTNGYRIPCFDKIFFEIGSTIEYYQGLFGARNVVALPFEFFSKDHDGFFRKIETCFSLEAASEIPRVKANATEAICFPVQRFLNHLGKPVYLKESSEEKSGQLKIRSLIARHTPAKKYINEKYLAALDDFLIEYCKSYHCDNFESDKKFNLNLSGFGYY